MSSLKNWPASAAFATALSVVAVVACSSSSNPQPVYNLDGGGDAAHPKTDGGHDAKSSSSSNGDAGKDATTSKPDSSHPVDAPQSIDRSVPADVLLDVSIVDGHTVDAAVCETDGGCYKCTPTTNAEFLNQCTTSACSPFNNKQRLPNYDGGVLPPLN